LGFDFWVTVLDIIGFIKGSRSWVLNWVCYMDPFLALRSSPGMSFFRWQLLPFCLCVTPPCQVTGFWSWCDWLRQQAIECGREPLFINLDETAVPRASPQAIGMVVGRRWWPAAYKPVQRVSKSHMRSMVTHVGLCTHNSEVQGRLPQIFVGNKHSFTLDLLASISQVAPSKVKFWREKSSWNNSFLMMDILREIALVMTEFPQFQPILVMDCAGIHFAKRVLSAASALGIWIVPVPARCTFLLQPCDTHVFSPYKAFLRRAFRECKDESGNVTPEAWARTLIEVATVFLCGRSWAHAFEQTGIIGTRQHLTREVASVDAQLPVAPFLAPSVRMVQDLWPRNRQVPYSQLLSEPLGRRVRIRIL
jgi:hypothetical protein